jgi:hypothetical protein
MSEHISAFAEILNAFSTPDRAAVLTREILKIFDRSADVPGEIETLLRDELAKAARHG